MSGPAFFVDWPTTDADRCNVPAGFVFDDPHDALWWDEGPIALFASSPGARWIATRAEEGFDTERWCCASLSESDHAAIVADVDALRRREIWKRNPVLVIECAAVAGAPLSAWLVDAERLRGFRPVFHDE